MIPKDYEEQFLVFGIARMRIDRSHFPWIAGVTAGSALAGLAYAANWYPGQLPLGLKFPSLLGGAPPLRVPYGGTPLGLLFGCLAFGIFLFAAALGVRKKKRLWPIGSVQTWLKAHLWLTVFTLPLVLLHSGFRLGGPHTTVLVILYSVVMASGIFGVILQHFLPSIMRTSLTREVVFEEIPTLRAELLEEANRLRSKVAEAAAIGAKGDTSPQVLCRFLDEECLPFLSVTQKYKARKLCTAQAAANTFKSIRLNVHPDWRGRVNELERICESRRLMDLQTRFQHWLHGWLLIHVPGSIALLLMTAWHAWVGIRFLVFQPH